MAHVTNDLRLAALSTDLTTVANAIPALAEPAVYEDWLGGESDRKKSRKGSQVPADTHGEDFPCQDDVINITEDFVRVKGHGVWAAHEPRLFHNFQRFNSEYFEGKLPRSEVKIGHTARPTKILGTHMLHGDHGTRCEITINIRLFTGHFPGIKSSEDGGLGHQRLTDDILLHEMMHAWCTGVNKTPERGHHGHGPYFAEQCNRVGVMLGLPPVRNSRATGEKTAELPSCANWPHNVRPKDYYLDAYEDPADDEIEPDATDLSNDELKKLLNDDGSFAIQMVKNVMRALLNARNTAANHRKFAYAVVEGLRRQCKKPEIFKQYPTVLPTLEELAEHAA